MSIRIEYPLGVSDVNKIKVLYGLSVIKLGALDDTYLKLLDILIDFQDELQHPPLEGLKLDEIKLNQESQS